MSDLVERAIRFAKEKHKGQVDDEGVDYFLAHCSQVARIVREVCSDERVIAAAYLHDTLKDTDTTYDNLNVEFGYYVADLVFQVTHEGNKETGYYFPNLNSRDAILIKFADRLSNLSRMGSWSKERQEHYLRKSKFWRSE